MDASNKETDPTITKPKSEMFQCKVCPYNTLRKPFLDKHMQQKHGFAKVLNEPETKKNRKKRIKTEPPSAGADIEFVCKICNFKAESDLLLNMHLKVHEIDDKEMYQCTQCDFKTIEVSALKNHERTHKTMEIFQCPHCDYATRHKSNYKAHLRTHEHPEKLEKYSCNYCDFISVNRNSIYKHISSKHSDPSEKLHCANCSYSTTCKDHLRSHMKKHMNPKNLPLYYCDICDLETYNYQTIRRHIKKHTDRNDEPVIREVDPIMQTVWYCCDRCEFRSKEQRYVRQHKVVHEKTDEINRATLENLGIMQEEPVQSEVDVQRKS